MGKWTNADGLAITFGVTSQERQAGGRRVITAGDVQQMVVDFEFDNLPHFDADADNDGTLDSYSARQFAIPMGPVGTYLKSATLVATVDWATADSAVLNLGLYEEDGTAIDADGIDAAIAASALDLGDVVACNGALIGTMLSASDGPHYLGATITVGSFTTGAARLVIEYEKVGRPDTSPSTGTVTIS